MLCLYASDSGFAVRIVVIKRAKLMIVLKLSSPPRLLHISCNIPLEESKFIIADGEFNFTISLFKLVSGSIENSYSLIDFASFIISCKLLIL